MYVRHGPAVKTKRRENKCAEARSYPAAESRGEVHPGGKVVAVKSTGSTPGRDKTLRQDTSETGAAPARMIECQAGSRLGRKFRGRREAHEARPESGDRARPND